MIKQKIIFILCVFLAMPIFGGQQISVWGNRIFYGNFGFDSGGNNGEFSSTPKTIPYVTINGRTYSNLKILSTNSMGVLAKKENSNEMAILVPWSKLSPDFKKRFSMHKINKRRQIIPLPEPVVPANVIESIPIKINIVDFIDYTEKYKGKAIKINLTLGGIEDNLKENGLGFDVPFYTFDEKSGARLDIAIFIPKSMDVPKAVYADKLWVTFYCQDGSLTQGNIAFLIVRP